MDVVDGRWGGGGGGEVLYKKKVPHYTVQNKPYVKVEHGRNEVNQMHNSIVSMRCVS